MRYEVRGLSLNVEKNGSEKPALVFLPYWGGTLTTWNNVVAELKDSFMTVLMIHVAEPKSDKSAAGYTLADPADETLSLIHILGIKSYVLVGHSVGGKFLS